MKKLISSLLAATICGSMLAAFPLGAGAAYEDTELFTTEVICLKEADYNMLDQKFTTISLKDVANNGYVDEVSNDGKGGWTDEGSKNDMRHFTFKGLTKFKGVPFDLVDPDENDGKAVVTCAGRGATFVPYENEIPIGHKAAGLYILHAHSWNYGDGDKKGQYTLVYDDGTSATVELYENENIHNFWGAADYATSQCVWKGKHPNGQENAIQMFAMSNPYPEKTIEKMYVASMDGGTKSWLHVLGVTLTDKGPYLPDMGIVDITKPSTASWIKYDASNFIAEGTALDASNLLEKPAGKHGVLKASGENFVFEDGVKFKFWGVDVNYVDAFADKETADKVADDIARLGYNLARIRVDVKTADDKKIDAIQYLISKLKENGVYTYLALNEDVDLNGFFDEELINAQKEGIRKLIGTTNKYTNTKLAEDSALAMLEFMPDLNLYYLNPDAVSTVNEEELRNRFNVFLKEKYGNTKALKAAWSAPSKKNPWSNKTEVSLAEDENIEDGTVIFNRFWRNNSIYTDARNVDVRKFFEDLQLDYYNDMKTFCSELGYKGVATLNSNPQEYNEQGEAYINSKTDFIARNAIWIYNYHGDDVKTPIYFNNKVQSSLSDNDLGVIGKLTRTRFANKPYVVSEWNTAWATNNPGEDYVVMATMAARQNWNPITYSYSSKYYTSDSTLTSLYDVYNNPVSRVNQVSAIRLFNALDEFDRSKSVSLSERDIYLDGMTPYYLNLANNKVEKYLLQDSFDNFYKYKITYNKKDGLSDKVYVPGKAEYKDDAVKIDLLNKEILISTDKAEAFACQESPNKKVELKNIAFDFDNYWYTAILSSVNGKKLSEDSMLLTLTASVRNKSYNMSNNYVNSPGRTPILAQPVKGVVEIKTEGDFDVYRLGMNGERLNKMDTFKTSNGRVVFNVNESSFASDTSSLSFEIVRKDG